MSLRKLTLLFIAVTTIGLAAVILVNTTRVLKDHFEQQEKNNIYLNIQQAKNALDQQITLLDSASRGQAKRDQTYQFLGTLDPLYIVNQLQPAVYLDLNVDLLVIINSKSEIIYAGMLNKDGQLSSVYLPAVNDRLRTGDPFLFKPEDKATNHGLLIINSQPMMIISHPILKSDASGPPAGTMLLGKFIDNTVLASIDNLLAVSVDIQPIPGVQNNVQYTAALSYTPTVKDPYYVDLTPSVVSGYAVLNDVFNQPAFIMRLERFPATYNNRILVNNYLIISVTMIVITFSTILFLLIEFNVLHRIRQLITEIQLIGVTGDIRQRLTVKRKDELASLASQINDMLGALENAHLQRRESEDRFRTLVESMEDVVFTVEREDRKVHVYERKGFPQASLPAGQTLDQARLLQADLENELARQEDAIIRSFRGENTIFEWSARNGHTARNFMTTLSPIYDGSQQEIIRVVGVSKDITSQKQLEQELRSRIQELGALFNISQQLLGEIEEATIHQVICRLAVEQIGMDAAWIAIPSPDGSVLLPAASSGQAHEALEKVALFTAPGETLHPAAAAFEQQELQLYSYHRPDPGKQIPADAPKTAAAIPLIHAGSTLAVLVLIREKEPYIQEESLPLIHAYVNLASVAMQNAYLFQQVLSGRERLQTISRRLVDVQEEERRKISLELHDEIGQILTSLHFSVDMIHSLPADKIRGQVQSSVEIINDLISRVRQMSLSLRPSMLDDLGIVPTLLWYFDRYSGQTGIQVVFQHNNLLRQRFSPDIEITVFRVVQEALTNVARHARVQTANVRLWSTKKIIGVQVEDAGAGFDQDQVLSSPDSKGLLGMRERVGFLRGQLHIVTQPGEGACLTAEIPLGGYLERRKRDRTGNHSR